MQLHIAPDAFDAIAKKLDALANLDLFFIAGLPRSGTTWMQRLANSHPEICCRGESHFIDILYALLRKNLQSYNDKVKLQGGALAHLKKYGGHVDSLEYDRADINLLLSQAILVMLGKWIEPGQVKAVGEKTPDNVLWLGQLSDIFPKARFIHVIRDGRDSAVSGWYFGLSEVEDGKMVTDSFEQYVDRYLKQWIAAISLSRSVGRRIGDRYLEVSYESLVNSPDDALARVFSFLGVDAGETTVRQCLDEGSFSRLSGGRQRGQEDQASFFRKGVIGDWRARFDDDAKARAWRVAGEGLQSLGYSRD